MGILEFFIELFVVMFDFLLKFSAVMMVSLVAVLIVIADEKPNLKRVLLAIAFELGSMYFIFS